MLSLGMPTLIETATLEMCASLCKQLQLQFIELNMNLPQYQLDRINVPLCQRIAEEHDVFYTIHLDENLNVSDFNPYIADGYRRTVTETIELAKRLHTPVINMHLSRGVYFTLPERKVYLYDEYKEQYLQSMVSFRKMCESAIGQSDMTICIENSDGFTEFQKKALQILLDSPAFGLTFDVGHDHSIGGLDAPYIMENESRLRHMHLHDALGKKNHMALGTGELSLAKYLSLAREHDCLVVLETKTVDGLIRSVDWLKGNGFAG